jgi:hypothetical protein
MSDQQRSLVTGEDATSLMKLLADRRRLTDALVAKTTQEGGLQERWESLRGALSREDRLRAERLLSELKETLAEMTRMDAEDSRSLEIRKRGVASELSGLSAGRAAVSAYGGQIASRGGVALDRTDEG